MNKVISNRETTSGGSHLTTTETKLPYLHKNSRSSRIPHEEILEVFCDEITRGLDRRLDREDYLRKVLP